MNIYNIISNIIIGTFTLLAALSSVWLKTFLDNKNMAQNLLRQKAIEAYALSNNAMNSLAPLTLIGRKLFGNKNWDYTEFYEKNGDNSIEIIGSLELIIIENFYDQLHYLYCEGE